MRPGQNKLIALLRYKLNLFKFGWTYKFLNSYEQVVQFHTKNEYDLIIHLPIEFPLVKDGHRPLSEGFRNYTDKLLRDTVTGLNINMLEVSGSLEERLQQVLTTLNVTPTVSIEEAITMAKDSMDSNQFKLEELKRRNSNDWEKAKKAL